MRANDKTWLTFVQFRNNICFRFVYWLNTTHSFSVFCMLFVCLSPLTKSWYTFDTIKCVSNVYQLHQTKWRDRDLIRLSKLYQNSIKWYQTVSKLSQNCIYLGRSDTIWYSWYGSNMYQICIKYVSNMYQKYVSNMYQINLIHLHLIHLWYRFDTLPKHFH